MADLHKRIINRLIVAPAVLLLAATVLVLAGSVLTPSAGASGAHPAMIPATLGMLLAFAALVELVRAFLAYRLWQRGRGERCSQCDAPVVAPYLGFRAYRCLLDRRHGDAL